MFLFKTKHKKAACFFLYFGRKQNDRSVIIQSLITGLLAFMMFSFIIQRLITGLLDFMMFSFFDKVTCGEIRCV